MAAPMVIMPLKVTDIKNNVAMFNYPKEAF